MISLYLVKLLNRHSFFKSEPYYLGHLLTTNGNKPQLENVKVITELKPQLKKVLENSLA